MEVNFGIWSLIPVLLTIVLAIKTRNVVISLFVGVFSGVLIAVGGNPVLATTTMVKDYFFVQLTDSYNAGVIVLLCFIGGFVALLENSGGAQSFAKNMARVVDSKAKAQLAAWFGGIVVFFSELGTPLIIGPIFEPLFEKMKISKEKLAWILDSTSSPVCVLVPFIGWGVYAMGLIQKEFEILNIAETDWSAFVSAIPFQIYPILCLIIVPMVALSGYEFGFMAKAELKARDGIYASRSTDEKKKILNDTNKEVSPLVVVLPLLVLFVTLFGILAPQGFPFKQVPGSEFRAALITGYVYAAVLMVGMTIYYKVQTAKSSVQIYMKGVTKMMEIIVVLILAWSLGAVGKTLGTSDYIVSLAQGNMPAFLVPAIIFLIGSVTSFATGTSWGTFAIMMPIAIPMAVSLGAPLYVCIGAVLSGGLFGDHCSPISDTTILASTGAGCGLLEHVKTQLPYAGLCGGITFVGYIVAGYFDSVAVTAVCIIALFVIYRIAARFKGIKIV